MYWSGFRLDFWHSSLRFRFLLLFVFRLSEPVSQVKVGRFRPPVRAARGRLGWTLDLKCGGSVWKFLVTSRFRLARFSNYSIRNVNIIHKWQADFNEGLPEEETFIIFQEMEDELSIMAGVNWGGRAPIPEVRKLGTESVIIWWKRRYIWIKELLHESQWIRPSR